jgi:hypothetical protein
MPQQAVSVRKPPGYGVVECSYQDTHWTFGF